jgi:hypothetical protein
MRGSVTAATAVSSSSVAWRKKYLVSAMTSCSLLQGDAVERRLGAMQPSGHVVHGQRRESLSEEQLLQRGEKLSATLKVHPSTADGTQ